MKQGELTVTGHDHYVIALRGLPAKVEAHFKDHDVAVPCNPHHRDFLECEVHHSNINHSGFVLKIRWEVTGVREIVWHVYY